ncbi:MAG: tetratricopeptide repeat protein [Candidatus Gastranaerophilales bacterium]|nr:tetratricopeptide repeat protein [Candidatus Gastranaerophilales bacterium]
MDYEFLNSSLEKDNIILPNSDKINPFLLKNNYADIFKAIDFIASDEKFLYIHGFMGTGKRQFINYITEFLNKDVIKLEYYCKNATVCDDILLAFSDIIDNLSISKAINLNAKITTLNVKFQQQISSIKKPFLIILHSLDDILDENKALVSECFSKLLKEENVKIIVSTRAMNTEVLSGASEDRKIFLKAFTKEVFKDFLASNQIVAAEGTLEDFYKYTRGYYYYTALTVKIIQAMKVDLSEFLQKFAQSGMSFDSYLGATYINLIPTTIRNFFWFLRTIRHGLSFNALAVFELYDEFSIEYLKTNLMIFQVDETIYVQDYFLQDIDISIPEKTEIKLHKYIIGIYEGQLKEALKNRALLISRQAMRAEIEYHTNCIHNIQEGIKETAQPVIKEEKPPEVEVPKTEAEISISKQIESANNLAQDKKYTDAIEAYLRILDAEGLDLPSLVEVRAKLAKLYKEIGNYSSSSHYYELVETYYIQHNELINLTYLHYEMTDLYYKMYKHERAIETVKKVIYSVDTPQSLMVSACILLGNIYSDMNNPDGSYSYYKKALESLDENVENEILAELYFKFALANDDRDELDTAFEYYNKCIAINSPYQALAYSNLASCYYDNESYDDAKNCFVKAYEIEKSNNNYDGIYYTAFHLAKICLKENSEKALAYLLEAKSSAEFINEEFYMLETSIALGDYYYNYPDKYKLGLREYFKAKNLAQRLGKTVDITKIEQRIKDMKLRMTPTDFEEIENKYGR